MKCPICKQETAEKYRAYTRLPADKHYISGGNHPKLIKAHDLINGAKELENQVREEQALHRKTLRAEYKHKVHVKVAKKGHFFNKIPEGQEYIVITSILTNEDIFKEHMNYFGSICGPPESSKSSVQYYRKHGILLHDSGGWLLLNDEEPCNNQQWEDLKAGRLHEFLTKETS